MNQVFEILRSDRCLILEKSVWLGIDGEDIAMHGEGEPRLVQKLEFGSREWLGLLAGLVAERAARHPELPDRIICEVYLNVPERLALLPGRKIAWTSRKSGNGATVWLGECNESDCDVKVVGDYAALRELGRFIVTPSNRADYLQIMEAELAAGRLMVIKDNRPPDPNPDYWLHNSLAAATL